MIAVDTSPQAFQAQGLPPQQVVQQVVQPMRSALRKVATGNVTRRVGFAPTQPQNQAPAAPNVRVNVIKRDS